MPTPTVYNQFKLKQFNGNAIDLDTDTIKVMIVTSSYTPSQSHDFINDASANEVSGTGYTAGGYTVSGVTVALDSNTVEFIHDDIAITQNASGFSNGRHLIWYKDTGNAATSPLIMYASESSDFGNASADVTIDGSATAGVLSIS